MSKKTIIYYSLLFIIVIIAMNLKSILNLYQNIFYNNICNNKFCIKKPDNYILIATIQDGVLIPSIPLRKPEKMKDEFSNGFDLVDKNFKDRIILAYLKDTKKSTIDRMIKKYNLKKDKNIKECYNATKTMNHTAKLNNKIFLICVDKKIRISETDKIDYKTIQNILDSVELKK